MHPIIIKIKNVLIAIAPTPILINNKMEIIIAVLTKGSITIFKKLSFPQWVIFIT